MKKKEDRALRKEKDTCGLHSLLINDVSLSMSTQL
jgi:hypothetical protein